MRKLALCISILVFLAGCSKKEPGPTTFSIKNSSSNTLYGFTTYYFDGSNFKELTEHGDLASGESTDFTSTDFDEVGFYFSYDPNGVLFYSSSNYTLNQHVKNLLEITDNTSLDGGTTYYVYNNTSNDLYGVTSFFLSGSEKLEEEDHGDLPPGTRTVIVATSRGSISVEYQLEQGGDTYRVDSPFTISSGDLNELSIDENTPATNQTPSTYYFNNMTTLKLYNFHTFYLDGTDELESYDHGTLNPGASTDIVSTVYDQISFYFSYDQDGVKFYSTSTYSIERGTENSFNLTNDTNVDGGTTYYVYNNFTSQLFDVVSYNFDNSTVNEEVDHGDLSVATRTRIISTSRSTISVEFKLSAGGDTYLVSPDYDITADDINKLEINDQTLVINLTSSARIDKSSQDAMDKIKLGDLLQKH